MHAIQSSFRRSSRPLISLRNGLTNRRHPQQVRHFSSKNINDIYQTTLNAAKHMYSATVSIVRNFIASRPIKKRLAEGDSTITRKEFQFMKCAEYDIRRFVPVLIASFLPFSSLLALPTILMFPSIIPKAYYMDMISVKIYESKVNNRNRSIKELNSFFKTQLKSDHHEDALEQLRQLMSSEEPLDDEMYRACARVFESSLDINEFDSEGIRYTAGSLALTNHIIIPPPFQLYNIKKHMAYIIEDDLLLKKDGIKDLTDNELRDACLERSLQTTDKTREEMEQSLSKWIQFSTMKETPSSLLLGISILNNKPSL